MPIVGWVTFPITWQRGVFFCPQCREQHPYVKKRAVCFMSVCFIPVLPIKNEGEWILCGSCGSAFRVEVLNHPPGLAPEELAAAVRRLLVIVMLDAGATTAENVGELRSFCQAVFGDSASDEQIQQDVLDVQQANASLEECAQHVQLEVDEAGKEVILQGASRIIAPGDPAAAQQSETIHRLRHALGAPR
jgi:hypothetical protein